MPSTIHTPGGSVALGTDKLRGPLCIDIVLSGLAAGYRILDTAQAYGNEEQIGEAIRQSAIPREEIFVSTKISDGYLKNPDDIQKAYDSALASIRRLDISYVDLFLIHAPGDDADARRATWRALERLVEEGLIREIGVSNYGVQHLVEMERCAKIYPPKVNQLELHPWCQQRVVERFCRSRGIQVQAACSLVRNQHSSHPGLRALAARYNRSTAQMLLRYSLQKGWTPVVKSSSVAHLQENADVHGFSIEADDMLLMDSWDEGSRGAIRESYCSHRFTRF